MDRWPDWRARWPSTPAVEYVFEPLLPSIVGDLGPTLLIVLGAAALLLLLACVNVTNLLLARGTARTREVAVRAALGASRSRLIRQLLTEALMIACAGALIALGLAYAAMRLMLTLGASRLPRLDTVPFDNQVLLFALSVTIVSTLAMGAAPAWRLARVDIRPLLNESGRSASSGPRTSRSMSALIVAEVALAIVMAAGAGWLVQSFERLGAVDPGFTTAGRLVIDVKAGRAFTSPAAGLAWWEAVTSACEPCPAWHSPAPPPRSRCAPIMTGRPRWGAEAQPSIRVTRSTRTRAARCQASSRPWASSCWTAAISA